MGQSIELSLKTKIIIIASSQQFSVRKIAARPIKKNKHSKTIPRNSKTIPRNLE